MSISFSPSGSGIDVRGKLTYNPIVNADVHMLEVGSWVGGEGGAKE